MSQSAAYGAYQRIQTETSSTGELVVMLYGALVNDLQRAEDGLQSGDVEGAHAALVRAQDIVMELIASLDMDSGELAQELSILYEYLYRRLVQANMEKDGQVVHEVASLVSPLRDAWQAAVRAAAVSPRVAHARRP